MTLLTYLKLDTSDLQSGVGRAQQEFGKVGAAASTAGAGAAGMGKLTDGLNQVQPAASKAVMGINAATAANGLMSGSVTGVASGTMALSNALKGLGVASGGTVALVVALAAAIAMLVMAMAEAKAKSARLVDFIQLGNAQGAVDSLRQGFERLVDTMDGAVGLMRELRALTREGMDIDADKRIRKEIEELERKNQVLEEQARIYEKRNEVVAVKREAAGIEAPEAEEEKKKQSGGISAALNVPTDRLTRIGGVTAGGFGAAFGGGVAEKQLAEARLTRQLLERIARHDPGAVLG